MKLLESQILLTKYDVEQIIEAWLRERNYTSNNQPIVIHDKQQIFVEHRQNGVCITFTGLIAKIEADK